MVFCGGLAWYRKTFFLLFIWLSNPGFLFSQQSTSAFINQPNTRKLSPGLLSLFQAWRVQVNDKTAFEQWTKQHFPAASIVQPSSNERILLIKGLDPAQIR